MSSKKKKERRKAIQKQTNHREGKVRYKQKLFLIFWIPPYSIGFMSKL